MSQLTPEFLTDLESRMRVITEAEYGALAKQVFWQQLAKETSSTSKRERLIWLLDTAKIEYVNRLGGEVEFDDILSDTTEFVVKAATAGLKLNRFQLEDHDGGGVQLAAHWSRQMGAYAAYWPQKQVLKAVRDGEQATSLTYDGKKFFDLDHPLNPFDSAAGTFDNVFQTAGTPGGPGAVDISEAVTLDVAVSNLNKAINYVKSIKMPNGEDPRGLKVTGLMVPSALTARAQQLTNAKFIASAASSGGGSADIEAIVRNWGLGQPIEGVELGAGFTNGSDTSYYLIAEQQGASRELGALVYINREPFSIVYHDGMTNVELSRANSLEWHTRGRNVVGYGHPFLLFKCKAA